MQNTTRTFIIGLSLFTVGWFFLTLSSSAQPTANTFLLALLFTGLMVVATLFPLHFDYKTRVVLDTSIIFAAVLLFDPAIAMLAVGAGALMGHLLRRKIDQELIFNTLQVMLQAGVASQLLHWSGWTIDIGAMQHSGRIALLLVAGTIYLLNTGLVAVIIGLQTGLNPARLWAQSVTRHDTIEQVSQFVLGLIAVYQIQHAPWSLPLLAFPILVIYYSLQRLTDLRRDTIEAVESLADLVDMRDPYTSNHARRVAAFAREIATDLGLEYDQIALIERAGRVHDLGKLIIDRSLLAKPGRLSDSDWQEFEQHSIMGAQMLAKFPEFADGIELVRWHHERLDGQGYPDRLQGEEIPLGARILAVADAFDAMASARPYRPALPQEVVLGELERGRGSQWDTLVVDSLLHLIEQGRIILPDSTVHPFIIDGSGQTVAFEESNTPQPAFPAVA